MAFEGGKIPLIGLTPSQLAYQVGAAGISQLPTGSGPFAGLAAGGANILLNVALPQNTGEQVAGQSGADLSSGQNILQTQLQPLLSSTLSSVVNTQISNSLASAGPFGALGASLAQAAAGSIINSATNAVFGSLFGGGSRSGEQDPLSSLLDDNGDLAALDDELAFFGGDLSPAGAGSATTGTRSFPGAGAEPAASYGGSTFGLGSGGPDVIFSIQSASNSTPQSAGVAQVVQGAATGVTVPTTTPTNAAPVVNTPVNKVKEFCLASDDPLNYAMRDGALF